MSPLSLTPTYLLFFKLPMALLLLPLSVRCDAALPLSHHSLLRLFSLIVITSYRSICILVLRSGHFQTRGPRLDFFSSPRPPKSRVHFCISVMMPSGRILKSLPDFNPHVTRYSRRGGTPVHSPHFLVIASSQSSPTKI